MVFLITENCRENCSQFHLKIFLEMIRFFKFISARVFDARFLKVFYQFLFNFCGVSYYPWRILDESYVTCQEQDYKELEPILSLETIKCLIRLIRPSHNQQAVARSGTSIVNNSKSINVHLVYHSALQWRVQS